MKIIKEKIRKSVVVQLDNIQEDLGLYIKEENDVTPVIQLWIDEHSETFFQNNPNVDDVLLFMWIDGKKGLRWIVSRETKNQLWVDKSCEHTEDIRRWLEVCLNKTGT